jgi:hypothetical protein
MKNSDQTTQKKSDRSFAQEMHQAFLDWVNQLPFMKNDIPGSPGREARDETPADQAAVPRATDGAAAERSRENDGNHR